MLNHTSKHNQSSHVNDNHGRKHHSSEHHRATNKKRIHHDWRFWTAIGLMLLGMIVYVLSFDESLRPGGVQEPEVPAAAE